MVGRRKIDRLAEDMVSDDSRRKIEGYSSRRLEATLKAWAAGYTFSQLADKFEYPTPGHARMVVEAALARSEVALDRETERERFALSLLEHHRTASELAADPEEPDRMAWMRMDLSIQDRIIKLYGLDAPAQVVVTPGLREFEQLTEIFARANGEEIIVEADPMEMREITDGS